MISWFNWTSECDIQSCCYIAGYLYCQAWITFLFPASFSGHRTLFVGVRMPRQSHRHHKTHGSRHRKREKRMGSIVTQQSEESVTITSSHGSVWYFRLRSRLLMCHQNCIRNDAFRPCKHRCWSVWGWCWTHPTTSFIFLAYWKSLSTSNVSYFSLKFHCEDGGKAPNTRK